MIKKDNEMVGREKRLPSKREYGASVGMVKLYQKKTWNPSLIHKSLLDFIPFPIIFDILVKNFIDNKQ